MDGFTVLKKMGEGSYAVVWKAQMKNGGKYVAIKQVI
jgi:hypothetical protein